MEALLLSDADLAQATRERLAKHSAADASGCSLWRRCVNSQGYGQLGVLKRSMSTHRVAYLLAHGAIPDGLCVLHRCDVRRCINPEHLFLGTSADNTADKVAKGRHPAGAQAPRAKLTDSEVETIRARCEAGESKASIARAYDISGPYVSELANGKYRRPVSGLSGGAR